MVIGQFMRWLMHPNASESGSYIKASIFSGFYSGGAIVVTYLFENNSLQSAFYIDWTKTRLWLGVKKHAFFAILLSLFN